MARKIILGVGVSLDGYVARPDGPLDFLFHPKDYKFGEFQARCDTAVMGRKTYEAGLKMGAERELKKAAIEYYVFSRTLEPGRRNYVTFVSEPLAPFVEALRAKPGKNIWHAGGGELAREFLKADLIDQMYLGVVPTLIGEGIPLFPPTFPQREFELTESKTYDGGLLALTYTRKRSA